MDKKKVIDFLKRKGIYFEAKLNLRPYTTYNVGGDAEIGVFPDSIEEFKGVIAFCKRLNIPCYVLGGGANVIVSDNGVEGVVCLTERLNRIRYSSGKIYAQCGVRLEKLSIFAFENGIKGFEFAYNIPGTVGGALIMNAGNNYGEFKNITCFVKAINTNGKEYVFSKDLCEFGYRTSIFKKRKMIILEGVFDGRIKGEKNSISVLMDKIKKERESKFPLEYPNAGSVFKRPKGYYAGKLIEESGCGGLKVGGAMVSTKHKGFIVNTGNATASDIKKLISLVQKRVYEKFGVTLQREQIYFPEDLKK